jgi:hypothetical protein
MHPATYHSTVATMTSIASTIGIKTLIPTVAGGSGAVIYHPAFTESARAWCDAALSVAQPGVPSNASPLHGIKGWIITGVDCGWNCDPIVIHGPFAQKSDSMLVILIKREADLLAAPRGQPGAIPRF